MRKFIFAILLLIIGAAVQVHSAPYMVWCPDFILLFVIYVSLFCSLKKGLLTGAFAGFLRGILSFNTIVVDIVCFVVVVFVSYLISMMIYKQNPILHVLVTMAGFFIMLSSYAVFFSLTSYSDVSIGGILDDSWRTVIITVLISPFFFLSLDSFLESKAKGKYAS
jgi:rod shape-determining protein MreD